MHVIVRVLIVRGRETFEIGEEQNWNILYQCLRNREDRHPILVSNEVHRAKRRVDKLLVPILSSVYTGQ